MPAFLLTCWPSTSLQPSPLLTQLEAISLLGLSANSVLFLNTFWLKFTLCFLGGFWNCLESSFYEKWTIWSVLSLKRGMNVLVSAVLKWFFAEVISFGTRVNIINVTNKGLLHSFDLPKAVCLEFSPNNTVLAAWQPYTGKYCPLVKYANRTRGIWWGS